MQSRMSHARSWYLSLALMTAGVGCREEILATPLQAAASTSASAEPRPAPTAELEAAASALMLAAQAFVGPRCELGADAIELIAIIPFDRCPTAPDIVAAYQLALAPFDALARRAPLVGAAATFHEKARMFGEFVKGALESGDTRGSAALYQDLALAHNRFRPRAAVAVDPPRIVALYFGVAGVPKTDYFRNLRKEGKERKAAFEASGRHFIWRRGPNGFEGPYVEGESRVVGGYE